MKTLQKPAPSLWAIAFKTGLLTAFALIAYFLCMKMFGLHLVLELRLFNFILLLIGISFGIYRLRYELGNGEYYLKGLLQGFLVTVVAVSSFSIMFVVYLLFFDHELIEHIRSAFLSSINYMNTMTVFFALMMEGLASGAIISFCAMQYFKTADIKKELNKELSSFEQN